MTRPRSLSVACALALAALASASLFAKVTTQSLPSDLITTPGSPKVQLLSARHDQPQQSQQSQNASLPPRNQDNSERAPVSETGIIRGTVTDINDAPVLGATVALQGRDPNDVRSVTTNENGFFEIREVEPGLPYEVSIRAPGFSEWKSSGVTLEPGESRILDVSKLPLEEVRTDIVVTPESSDEIAIEQVQTEEKQRGFLIIPNFYAVYTPNPAPLTAKLKFSLALRVARDPFTLAGVAALAGIGQAEDNPEYGPGAKAYGERYAANYANDFTNTMLDGAILASVLHQDPRYFYKGTGTTESRVLHAISSLFLAKGDDGRWQPNYSSLGGDLATAALSNFYYPKSSRSVGVAFQSLATIEAVHVTIRLLGEFAFRPSKARTGT